MEYPLQTRAACLNPDRLDSTERLERTLNELVARSYNTVIVPVLYEGSLTFRTTREGHLKGGNCPGARALRLLRDYPLTVWLTVDLLTAGAPGSGTLGSLASRRRTWLMRNIDAGFEPPEWPGLPGLFCWTSLDYRRYLGALLVDIAEAFPFDGIIFDVRHLPRSTREASTWTHLGFSCLQRIQRELRLDWNDFLSEPTMEKFNQIADWRHTQFLAMLENLKARVQKVRRELPFFLLGTIRSAEDPYAPWAEQLDEGLVEELILFAEGEQLVAHVEALERTLERHLPFLAGIAAETDLADVARALPQLPANGFCVMSPGPLQRVVMPEPEYTWNQPGALESHPVQAATEIVKHLVEEFGEVERLGPFLKDVLAYFINSGDMMKYSDAVRMRDEILAVVYRLRDGALTVPGEQTPAMRKLEQVARLLLLTPVPALEY